MTDKFHFMPDTFHLMTEPTIIEEFTQLQGGCTVNENVGGYYLSRANEVINDRVSVVYCDFPLDWNKNGDRVDVLGYCAGLKEFLFKNLWEEEILISVYSVSHVRDTVLDAI